MYFEHLCTNSKPEVGFHDVVDKTVLIQTSGLGPDEVVVCANSGATA